MSNSEQLPRTFMEQLCQAHPDLELGPSCVSWFIQATDHCVKLVKNIQNPSLSCVWTTVKNFIFPERSTDVIWKMAPISIEPNHLSAYDCQTIFLEIVNDYTEIAPRFEAEYKINVLPLQLLYSLIVIIYFIAILKGTIKLFKKFGNRKNKRKPVKTIFECEKQDMAKRSLLLAKSEVRLLKVTNILKPEELIAPDGTNILVLKVSTKFEFINSIVASSLQTSGRLYRSCDQVDKTKSEFQTESLNSALNFLGNNCKKLRLLIIFDADPVYEADVIQARENITLYSLPREIIRPSSPRSQTASTRPSISSNKRTSATASGSAILITSTSLASKSPRSSTPKQGTTPRAGTPRSSAIPRTVAKQSPKITSKKFV